jgi:hypothetical protein
MSDNKSSKRPTRNLIIYLVFAAILAIGLLALATRGPGSIAVPHQDDTPKSETD